LEALLFFKSVSFENTPATPALDRDPAEVRRVRRARGCMTSKAFMPHVPSKGIIHGLVVFLVCAGAAGAGQPLLHAAALESISLESEGRLLRVHLNTDESADDYTLTRQGPPEKRDLVLRLPGFVDRTPATIDTGDYIMPIDVTIEQQEGKSVLKVTLGLVGDSLVQVAKEGARLSVLLIPPETHSEEVAAYHIGANDQLQIDVFGHEDLNKTLKVSPRGLINFPLIGNVHAAGRTVDDLANEITERLGTDYIQDPHVTVSVWEYLSQWVNVVGEVSQPGRYYMTGPTSLIDALSQAGGLTEEAAGKILVTRRPDQVDPSSAGEVFRVDITELFSEAGGELDLLLRSGDIVNVPGGDHPSASKQ
jgi:protein involved in polysaccharide export with SLBB domain